MDTDREAMVTRPAAPPAGTSDEDLLRDDQLPSVTAGLHAGRVRWELIDPFPQQDPAERSAGDLVVREVTGLLRERLDPTEVEQARVLPAGLVDELRTNGFLKLGAPVELGGRGLTPYNVFRVLSAAVSWSSAVGPVLTADNGLGVGAYLPALPAGPLRDWVREKVAAGVVSCTADTEPTGAHNQRRLTTAVPAGDGTAYLLTGEKVYVANAPVADVLVTTATVATGDGDQLRLFFVDGHSDGIQVKALHDFIGLAGFPNGNLRFDRVRVPAERMLVEPPHGGRLTPATTRMVVRGRMYHVGAPSLAFARLALHCARDFVRRRVIDDRPLGGYEEIQRRLADSLADTFAIETVSQWCLLAERDREVNPLYEQLAAKNIASMVCWRVIDRTMSMLGAEGLETMASKARRGAPAQLPMERLFRDARIMRITGGVDFQLDNWAGRHLLTSHYAGLDGHSGALPGWSGGQLSARNLAHAKQVEAHAARLAGTCQQLVRQQPDQAALFERERLVILLSRLTNELLTSSLVLARASRLAAAGEPAAQDLADHYCTGAALRLERWWRELATEAGGADHAVASERWLHGDAYDFLLDDLVTPDGGR